MGAFEQKNENANNETQGRYTFATGGGRTAFQNFLTGNRDRLCGTPCTYAEVGDRHHQPAAVQPLRDVRAGHVAARRRT